MDLQITIHHERTNYANECLMQFIAIYYLVKNNPSTYCERPECNQHYYDYVEGGIELYHEGLFDSEGLLANMDFDDRFNYRGGFTAIEGTRCELAKDVIRNQEAGGTKSYPDLNSSKASETSGIDGIVVNERKGWGPYTVQVKKQHLTPDGKCLIIHLGPKGYFQSKYDGGHLNRMAFVDYNNMTFMETNFQYLKSEALDPDPIPGLIVYQDSSEIHLSIEVMQTISARKRRAKQYDHINFYNHKIY